MPYKLVKEDVKFCVYNSETGKLRGCHDTMKKAQGQMRLLQAISHGWKPTKSK